MGNQAGESGEKRESESRSVALRKPLRGGDRKKREKKKQRLSSEALKLKADERKRKSGTGPGG